MKKPAFWEFLKNVYNMRYDEYIALHDAQQKAIQIDYKDRYGSIKWW